MPSTRRSSGRPSAAGGGKQSTLSFNHRVTKSVPKSSKDVAISSTVHTPSPLSKSIEIVAEVQPEEEEEQIELEPESEPEPEPTVPEKSEAEVRAEKLTDAHINKYWRAVEAQRMVKRVHQEDLSVGEKVLRYFDVSSQYGPCIGMPRMRRWTRAQKLGLNPPIEVLAVLLKETEGNNAHLAELMNATAGESA